MVNGLIFGESGVVCCDLEITFSVQSEDIRWIHHCPGARRYGFGTFDEITKISCPPLLRIRRFTFRFCLTNFWGRNTFMVLLRRRFPYDGVMRG